MKLPFSFVSLLGTVALATALPALATAKLQVGSAPPEIRTRDVAGNPVRIPEEKNGYVLLTFFRGSGCPLCRLRFQEVEDRAAELKTHRVESIAIFEDQENFLRLYTSNKPSFTRLVADPDGNWYRSYELEKSFWGLMKTMLHGGMKKASAGNSLLATTHGGSGGTRLSAEFLIDGSGKIIDAHYAEYVGDHLSLDTILQETPITTK